MELKDKELIESLYDRYNKGLRINSNLLTDVYNRVTNRSVSNTTCGSCLRLRLFDLVNILNNIKKTYKLSKEDAEFLLWTLRLEEGHYPSFDSVVEMYNRVFNLNRPLTNCLPCIKGMLNELYSLL